jgi:hypothetical protein
MLDRTKIIKEIEASTGSLFTQHDNQVSLAFEKWQEIAQISDFKDRIINSHSSFLLPGWQDKLDLVTSVRVNLPPQRYAVLAIDGSQIYPERHISGINCFLINTGQSLLEYSDKSRAAFASNPKIFTPEQVLPGNEDKFSPDLVDLKREELELKTALNYASELLPTYKQKNLPLTVFVDGTLIFWTLESKPPEIKKYFLEQYIQALDGFYQLQIPIAGYISMPKSRELVNLTKIGFCRFELANCIPCHSLYQSFPCKAVDHVLDTQLCSKFLDKYQRTNIFQSSSKIIELYPEHLKPYFFYLNVGPEIIRLELPAWTAQNQEFIDLICNTAIDQVIKGYGYPVVLAEAHEQAVIKGSDRDFFYQLICKKSVELKQKIIMSPKSLKKRRIGI